MTTLCSRREDIERTRGDTTPIIVELVDADCEPIAETIAGATFQMTVSEEEWPDTNPPLFEIVGTDLDDVAKTVTFLPTGADADNLGAHYYDVEMIESGGVVHTVLKGLILFEQDITKSDETFEWTPLAAPSDGDPVGGDGSVDWLFFDTVAHGVTYQTRDGRRVMRLDRTQTGTWETVNAMPVGPGFPRDRFFTRSWEFKLTLYIARSSAMLLLNDGLYWNYAEPRLDTRGGVITPFIGGGFVADVDGYWRAISGFTPPDGIGWPDSGWFVLGVKFDADRKLYAQIRPEADADDWLLLDAEPWPSALDWLRTPMVLMYREFPENAASLIDLWKYEWRRL